MVTSRKMPGALSNRVFGQWWTWAKEQNGDLVVALTPHEDFGLGAEKEIVDAALEAVKASVLGKLRGFYRIKTLAPNVSRVTMVAQGALGGNFTKQAMAWAVKNSLGMVKLLQDNLTSEQDALVARCLTLEKGAEGSNVMAAVGTNTAAQARAMKGSWVELKSTSPFVSMSMAYTEPEGNESSIALGKAMATLDCSARDAFAYQFVVCGREKTRISGEEGDLARFIFKEHAKHDFEWASVKKMLFPLTNREFLGRYLSFKEPTGDLVLVFEALPDSTKVDYGANLKVVRGKIISVMRFGPFNDDTQCEVTLVSHLDAGGFLPERVVVAKIPEALSGVSEMRELFQRDDAIDGAKRGELAAIINTSKQPYLPDENKLIKKVGARFASLPAFEKLDSPDHFVHMSSALKEGSSSAILRASTIVDAPIAEVAAWEMAKMSRENQKEHVAFGGLDRNLKKINDHQNIYHVVYDLSIPTFLPRQWVTMVVWKWAAGKEELTVVADSVEHDAFSERKEYLRASGADMFKYKQEVDMGEIPQTKVTWTLQMDLGGRIPKWVQDRQVVDFLMYLSAMRKCFDRSADIDAASNLRLVAMIESHDDPYTEKEEEILRTGVSHISMFEGLKGKELKMASPSTKAKVAYQEGNSFAFGPAGDSKAKLCNVSTKEAKVIGGALASCIAANLTAPAAVDEWILRYPAMGELEREYVWFRPMMDTIAQRLLESVGWGLKMRLYMGAGLSTIDLLSDLYMIYFYSTTSQQGTALSLAVMVGLCLLLQLLAVWMLNHKGPRRVVLKEMLIVLSGMKPGIDAKRVADGNEKAEHAAVDPDVELTCTKAFELLCESIPGTLLQLTALFKYMRENDGDYSKKALGSIIVSACTTGFTAATISFDFDVSPQRRRDDPTFYGYIPDSAGRRTAIFLCMIMNGALLLLLRSVSTALLAMVNGR
ncbi:hypothetical protein TeGR_g9758 [Tetraparma gracilis]|uniref:START domain-containing protein n=1 Tax=Tetraparma gracilis TaxID=2962635 RepID=A0ABQ6MQ57_9STRA|nr:hypothetical protein TeGR_g9758 [Tetraparma gracilis]